jgi:hypothetical protein
MDTHEWKKRLKKIERRKMRLRERAKQNKAMAEQKVEDNKPVAETVSDTEELVEKPKEPEKLEEPKESKEHKEPKVHKEHKEHKKPIHKSKEPEKPKKVQKSSKLQKDKLTKKIEKQPVKHTKTKNIKPVDVQSSNNPFNKEVAIKFNPAKILKVFLFLSVLVLVFFVGRLSVSLTEDTSLPSTIVDSTPEQLAEVEESNGGAWSWITGLFVSEEIIEPEIIPEPEPTVEEPTPEVEEEPETVPEPEVVAPEPVEEPLVTTYDDVTLELLDVGFEWKETWGKLDRIKYSLLNKENGKIEPSYVLMSMVGYPDFEKRVDLPSTLGTIGSNKKMTSWVNIPFSYNPLETDVNNAAITIKMYDSGDREIDVVTKTFDLEG